MPPMLRAQKSDYPLLGIGSGPAESMTPEEVAAFATTFSVVHGNFKAEDIAAAHAINSDMKILFYVNSSYTSGRTETLESEQRRGSIAMYRVGTLATNLDSLQQTVTITPLKTPSGLKASSIEGNYSGPFDLENPSTQRYVTWVAVGDELLRLNTVNSDGTQLAVTRGFDNTATVAHAQGTTVFAPVYIGSSSSGSSAHAGGSDKYLRYAFRNDDPDFNQWKAAKVMAAMDTKGYDGGWLDILSASRFNQVGMDGEKCYQWDFAHGEEYTNPNYRLANEKKINTYYDYIEQQNGRSLFLFGNNIHGRQFFEEDGGEIFLIEPTDIKPRPIDGMCSESWISTPYNNRFDTADQWREDVQMAMYAAQNNLRIDCHIGNAGSKTELFERWDEVRLQHEFYSYASYLLAVEKDSKLLYGVPVYIRTGPEAEPARTPGAHPMHYYGIGHPLESVPWTDIDQYKIPGHEVYTRRFTNGITVVNPTNKTEGGVPLGGTYKDPETGEVVTGVYLPANTGKILLAVTPTDIAEVESAPLTFRLSANYPNPFNPSTTLQFTLPRTLPVIVDIFDITGRRVVRIADISMDAGSHRITWNGKTETGITVPAGIYIARLTAGPYSAVRKMAFIK